MSTIRREVIGAVLNRSASLIDRNIYNDNHKRHEFRQQIVLADKSLTEGEKAEAIKLLNRTYDSNKVFLCEQEASPATIKNNNIL